MQVLRHLDTHGTDGLDEGQVAAKRLQHGTNELPKPTPTPFVTLVLKQFDDLLVKILIVAAVVDFVITIVDGESGITAFVEPFVILLILAANAAVGVVTETNAEAAISALKALEAESATVIRDGKRKALAVKDIVPGDLVDLAVGEKVPADCYVIAVAGSTLRVDQSILTGESGSVDKVAGPIDAPEATVAQDKHNVLFSGSLVTTGRCACRRFFFGLADMLFRLFRCRMRWHDVALHASHQSWRNGMQSGKTFTVHRMWCVTAKRKPSNCLQGALHCLCNWFSHRNGENKRCPGGLRGGCHASQAEA